jgi:hypothetical protein
MNAALPEHPLLRIVRGNPDAGEIAALVAALTRIAATDGQPAEPQPPQTMWGAPRTMVRAVVEATGWWEHGLPR